MNTTDPRVQSAEQLLTGARLLAGHGEGLVRVDAIGRLLGCSIWNRIDLLDWIEAEGLWHERPYPGPLADRPNSGTVDLDTLRNALLQGLKTTGGLPFAHTLDAKP